jgi:hypothetical protein
VRLRRLIPFTLIILALAAANFVRKSEADEWLPISPDELKMTSLPETPGAPAVILYREVDRDDSNAQTPHEYNYVRTKIFTDDGRKYADAEIPFVKDRYTIINIRARTIHPDGSIVDFDGKVYEKEIVKARGLKYLAKTFTFSDVQPGSIIEYHYMIDFKEDYLFDSHWILSDELYTRSAKFTLKPYRQWALRWSWPNGLPMNSKPPVQDKGQNGLIHMEGANIPAFQVEDDMPPENAMKFRVDFNYSEELGESDPDKYWRKEGKKMNDLVEGFVNKKKAMEEAVAQTVSPGDAPEVKLQKIYERVQKIRNTDYEVEKTEQEQKRAHEKGASTVEDVWRKGYGASDEITLLFLAMARAAGMDASVIQAATREDHFFSKQLMKARDLHTYVVLVKLNGKELYFDPGSAFNPYAMLPWEEAGTEGLKLDKDGGTWVTTANPDSSTSRIERKAQMKLTQEGSLEGKLTVTYSGEEALQRRVEERNEDDTSKKKVLEDDVRAAIPATIEVELTNKPDWTSSAATMVAEFDLKVPGWCGGAGKHAMMEPGIFGATEKHVYEHTERVYPLYFHYMSKKVDDVTIELPLGWQVSSVPKPNLVDAKLMLYSMQVDSNNGTLHLQRTLKSDLTVLEQKQYPILRKFYSVVRTGDEEQIVLQPM